ncbi:MAG TPA: hypothetical protein VHV30_04090 [Polyangiaceae bacterium]|nr:hypothetical protein [Polyangiaceae bacterium]
MSLAALEPYVVFAQRPDARVEIDAWTAHAERFFATRLGLAEAARVRSDAPWPTSDRARFVVAPEGTRGDAGIREAEARPTTEADRERAERADKGGGLALLVRRCPMVWTVTREAADDPLALRLAAILSSVLLGPVIDPVAGDLIGAKTARERLAARR